MLTKSPSGSLCPYYYKGGELHPLKYGSFKSNSQALLDVMDAEEKFILASHGSRNIWIDLYDTDLNMVQLEKLALHIYNISHKTARLALVGCSRKTVKLVRDHLYRQDCPLADRVQYFKDPEIAKDWLVGKLIL